MTNLGSDMGWSRYIAGQEAAADLEMAADAQLADFIKDNGLEPTVDIAARAYLAATGEILNQKILREALWGVVEAFCVVHPDPNHWHDTTTGGQCSADETCPTCKHEPRPAAGHMCMGCSYVEPYAETPSILDLPDLPF